MNDRLSYIYLSFWVFCLVFITFSSEAQQLKLGSDPTQINKAALLELKSPNQGLLLSRVNDTSDVNHVINALSTAQKHSTNGMLVFQKADSSLYIRSGGYWRKLVVATPDLQRTFSYPTRILDQAFLISTTRDAHVNYTINMVVSTQGGLGSTGSTNVSLQISSSDTGPWVTISQIAMENKLDLLNLGLFNFSLGGEITSTQILSGWIPQGQYVRIKTEKEGNASIYYIYGQEIKIK